MSFSKRLAWCKIDNLTLNGFGVLYYPLNLFILSNFGNYVIWHPMLKLNIKGLGKDGQSGTRKGYGRGW